MPLKYDTPDPATAYNVSVLVALVSGFALGFIAGMWVGA